MYDYNKLVPEKIWQKLLKLLPTPRQKRFGKKCSKEMFGKGNIDDKRFLKEHLVNTRRKRKKVINLDMKYMSIKLRREMMVRGIRINMKWRKQDYKRKRGPKFKLDEEMYKKRFEMERINGWLGGDKDKEELSFYDV